MKKQEDIRKLQEHFQQIPLLRQRKLEVKYVPSDPANHVFHEVTLFLIDKVVRGSIICDPDGTGGREPEYRLHGEERSRFGYVVPQEVFDIWRQDVGFPRGE